MVMHVTLGVDKQHNYTKAGNSGATRDKHELMRRLGSIDKHKCVALSVTQ